MDVDARRIRNLRGLHVLRVVSAAAGAIALHDRVAVAGVVIAIALLGLMLRSPWYQREGWFALGGIDFAMVAVRGEVAGVALNVAMVVLAGLVLQKRAIAGAAALAVAGSAFLLWRAAMLVWAPVVVVAVAAAAGIALVIRARLVAA